MLTGKEIPKDLAHPERYEEACYFTATHLHPRELFKWEPFQAWMNKRYQQWEDYRRKQDIKPWIPRPFEDGPREWVKGVAVDADKLDRLCIFIGQTLYPWTFEHGWLRTKTANGKLTDKQKVSMVIRLAWAEVLANLGHVMDGNPHLITDRWTSLLDDQDIPDWQ